MVNFQVIYVIYVICMVFWDLFAHLFTLQVSTRPKILFVVISCNQPSVFFHPSFLTIFFSFPLANKDSEFLPKLGDL